MREIDDDDMHPDFLAAIRKLAGPDEYVQGHLARYMHTLRHMPVKKQFKDGPLRVLEIGCSFVFPAILLDLFGYDTVDITHFRPGDNALKTETPLPNDEKKRSVTAFNINLEEENIPISSDTYDLVLCFEVIEHMEKDPMFLISEINRILKPDGLVYITTPNITSARNVYKILLGYAPHFFMKYSKQHSLYRHNIEYAPHQLQGMLKAGGFDTLKLWTADNFESSLPEMVEKLTAWGYKATDRGDNLLAIGRKVSSVVDRHPPEIYF